MLHLSISELFEPARLHAMAVHFPIALIVLSTLLNGYELFIKPKRTTGYGFYLLIISCACLLPAYFTGDDVAEWIEDPKQLSLIETHASSALYCIWIAMAALLCLSLARLKDNYKLACLGFFIQLVLMFVVWRTAHLGGALVFDHHIGIGA